MRLGKQCRPLKCVSGLAQRRSPRIASLISRIRLRTSGLALESPMAATVPTTVDTTVATTAVSKV